MKFALITLIGGINLYFLSIFLKDYRSRGREETFRGNPVLLGLYTCGLYFLGTFGVPDFAISTVTYLHTKWVDEKDLPGTLNAESVIPVAVMAVCYITLVEVSPLTLILPIAAQVLGAYISPRYVVHLNAGRIKFCVSIGLLVASGALLCAKFGLLPSAGTCTQLHGWRLFLCVVFAFFGGVLNNLGIGSFSVMLAALYGLGLSGLVAYPIMMGACAVSVPVGSVQFIREGRYSRKVTLFSSIFGSVGVLIAIFVVKQMDLSAIMWAVIFVLLFSSLRLLYSLAAARE